MVSPMKKLSWLLCLIFVVSLLAGCGAESSNDTTRAEPTAEATEEKTTEKAADVTITIKKDAVVEVDDFIQNMESFGAEVKNEEDDDSLFFTFSSDEYKKLLDAKKKECIDNFKGFENDPDNYVEKIEYDDNFRNITISVNKELYDVVDSTVGEYAVAANALAYQMYINENQHTNVSIVYTGTEDVISTFSLPVNFSVE